MTPVVCATVDVEDFYEGMAVLGAPVEGPRRVGDRLEALLEALTGMERDPKVTLFVVGWYARELADSLCAFASSGHEIASHGVDHGRLPPVGLAGWLRRGREELEDLVQVPVKGFRSPRFDIADGGLAEYRDALAEAGFRYVSDTSCLGASSPVGELPVLDWRGLRVGGGSYQRVLPPGVVDAAVRRSGRPAVLYYHSYDFDGSLPDVRAMRSMALARQLLGRRRIGREFRRLVGRFGSQTCTSVALGSDVTG